MSLIDIPREILLHEILSISELLGVGPILRMTCTALASAVPPSADPLDFVEYLGAHYAALSRADERLRTYGMAAACEYTHNERNEVVWRSDQSYGFYLGSIADPDQENLRNIRQLMCESRDWRRFDSYCVSASPLWANVVTGHSYDIVGGKTYLRFVDAAIYAAAYHGNLEELVWRTNNIPALMHDAALFLAAERNHLDIVVWGLNNIADMKKMEKMAQILVRNNVINAYLWQNYWDNATGKKSLLGASKFLLRFWVRRYMVCAEID